MMSNTRLSVTEEVLVHRAPVGGAAADRVPAERRAVAGHGAVEGLSACRRCASRPGGRACAAWSGSPCAGPCARSASMSTGGRAGSIPARHSDLVDEQVAEPGDAVLVHEHRLDRRRSLPERVVELRERQRHRVGTEPALVGVELDRAEPARIAQHEVAAVGEVHAEAMPLRDAPVARVEQRVAGLLVVDEHAAAHAEVHAEAHVGVAGVQHDLLAPPARRRERVADERVPQRGASCPAS